MTCVTDVEVSTQVFSEFTSVGHVRECLERIRQCRGFLQMMEKCEDCPVGQFAEATLGLTAAEMKHLGEASGAVRSAVCISFYYNQSNLDFR